MYVVNFFPALNLKISIVVTIQSASSNIFSSFFSGKGATDVAKKKPSPFLPAGNLDGQLHCSSVGCCSLVYIGLLYLISPGGRRGDGGTFLRLENENK